MTSKHDEQITTKIERSSRYSEPLYFLQGAVSSRHAFQLIHNSVKDTYRMPYLYAGYKTQIVPSSVADKIVKAIQQYFKDNLFNSDERTLLLTALRPRIENFGDETIKVLNSRIELNEDKTKYADIIFEYKKTISALEEIRYLLINKFSEKKLWKQK